MDIVSKELEKVGIHINSVYDLVNTNKSYPKAIPVLIKILEKGIDDTRIKEGIIRALAVKDAKGKANKLLIEEYNRTSKEHTLLRWAIGNTIESIITPQDFELILPIINDKTNGISRQRFVASLGKIKDNRVEDLLISVLNDIEITSHAIEALRRMKSTKALPFIKKMTTNENRLIRGEALKFVKAMS